MNYLKLKDTNKFVFNKVKEYEDFLDREIRLAQNQETLNSIYFEMVQVAECLRECTDIPTKKILNQRFEYLANKYAYSNSINEVITYT